MYAIGNVDSLLFNLAGPLHHFLLKIHFDILHVIDQVSVLDFQVINLHSTIYAHFQFFPVPGFGHIPVGAPLVDGLDDGILNTNFGHDHLHAIGIEGQDLFQEINPAHIWYSLIHDHQLNGILIHYLEPDLTRICRMDVIILTERRFKAAQVLLYFVDVKNRVYGIS